MPLSVGDKLGPYEILAPIGAGGMGEVYKALDTKLDREVAIKVLPAALARDPERLARFEREAKVLASLNHPNIAQIYGIEESRAGRALVMELVPGHTLKGPIPLDEALRVAAQIADALGAAHEKGITHRDLKPANVMITPEGVVKVLDFGLAAVSPPSSGESHAATNSPTLTMSPTSAGMILGTAAYMSPEQARGQHADRRSDIWAFGVLLYEMLTDQQLFRGNTVSDILASVLKEDPDLERVPPEMRPLLKRCLEKEPKKRLQAIGDWELLLNVGAGRVPSNAERVGRGRTLPWILATVLAIGLIGVSWIAYRATRPAELKPLVRLDVDLGPDVSLNAGPSTILSPDGSRLVFVSQNRLFTRRLDQLGATELPGTQGATSPFFSPDGQWVAFFSQNRLRKISVEGGSAIALCDSGTSFTGGSWGEDGNIIVALAVGGPLSRISAAGGTPTPITELDRTRGEVSHRWPQVLPGGKAILFMAHTGVGGFDGANIDVMTLTDRRRKTLVRGGVYPRYLPSGHLLYVNGGTLFAVPFDLDTLALRGAPVPLVEQVAYSAPFGYAQLDFSRNGTLVYRSGRGAGLATVQWLDGAGKLQPLLAKPGPYFDPKLSPDGLRLAISTIEGSNQDIWVYELQRDIMKPLTYEAGSPASLPLWTPDGQYVVFQAGPDMYWTRADGAGKAQSLRQTTTAGLFPGSVTADGKRLAYHQLGPGTLDDLWTVPLVSDSTGLRAGKPELFLQTPFNERDPSFSPDGRWLAYDSDGSGAFQIYVRDFPDKGGKWQVSNTGGVFPEWSRDGRELFFLSLDDQIMVASYSVKGDSFVTDKPRLWSEKRLAIRGNNPTYDVAPDGKRIAALMPAEGSEDQKVQNHVIFLENFFDELRRKVPARK
ncbi:MAG TPA: protein kinase [Bryobacteraceae bacterium]|nr:protein kinase [Bryobacteraceae bacterium]